MEWFPQRYLEVVKQYCIQYDVFEYTKEVLKDFCPNQEDKLQYHLTSQGFFFSMLSSTDYHLSTLFGRLPSLTNPIAFIITLKPFTTSAMPFLHVRI